LPCNAFGIGHRAAAVSLLTGTNRPLKLKEGEDVKLKFAQEINCKTAAEGDTVNFVDPGRRAATSSASSRFANCANAPSSSWVPSLTSRLFMMRSCPAAPFRSTSSMPGLIAGSNSNFPPSLATEIAAHRLNRRLIRSVQRPLGIGTLDIRVSARGFKWTAAASES